MAKLEGIENVKRVLRELRKRASQHRYVSIVTGYTQNYALVVHETNKNYRTGSWKYLEIPARALRGELARIVRDTYKRTRNLEKACIIAGMRLQRESQLMCPVDTSALKASAFTAREKDLESVSSAAKARSDEIRQAAIESRAKK